MAKYCLKKPSKRLTCKKRYKIEKKVRDHDRKLKKESKKKNHKKKNTTKLINVPNDCPFKMEILEQAEQARADVKELKRLKKLEAKNLSKQKKQKDVQKIVQKATSLTEPNINYESNYIINSSDLEESSSNQKSLKFFASEVRKTIEIADVVLEILDARDPLGSRNYKIEEYILSKGKRLVLVLNKIDLIPKENVKEWLNYLRKLFPTIAFKASTQDQNQKLGRYITANLYSTSAKCIGADLIMKLLNNYCRNKDIKTSISVGIVGYPNVGKSSIINSLKRKKSCQTGNLPGVTRQMQEIELDKHIRLIDSPGVVIPNKDDQLDSTELALKNVVKIDSLTDPIPAINAILRRCSVKMLMMHYCIAEFADCEQFLALLARRFGKIKKGGRPDVNAAAKQVLNDWISGKLRYHTKPPLDENNVECFSNEIVSSYSKEFDIEALDGDIKVLIDALPNTQMHIETEYKPKNLTEDYENNNEINDENMDHDGKDVRFVVTGKVGKKNLKQTEEKKAKLPQSLKIDGNSQINKAIKTAVKKYKKQQKKTIQRTEKLAENLSKSKTFDDENMDYDFNVLNE